MKSERSWAGIICGFVLFIVVCLSLLLHMKGHFAPAATRSWACSSFAARAAASCLSRTAGAASFARRDTGGAGLHGDDAAVLRDPPDVLAGDGVVLSAVFWCALGALCFCLSAPGLIPGAVIHRANKLTQANRPRFSLPRLQNRCSRRCVSGRRKSAARFQPVCQRFFQVSFADAFGMNIHVAVVEIITLVGQFFCQFFSANAVRAAWTTKNNGKHCFSLKPQPDGEWRL